MRRGCATSTVRPITTVCHPKILVQQTKRFPAGPPQHHSSFASTSAEVSAAKRRSGRSIKVPYQGDSYFMGYSYDEKTKRYRRSLPWGAHVLADGTRVTTDNVVVIKARQHCGKIFQGNGGKEPLYNIAGYAGTFY